MIIDDIKQFCVSFLQYNGIIFNDINIIPTDDAYEGDVSILLFDIIKNSNNRLVDEMCMSMIEQKKIKSYNLIKGFLNISLFDKDIISLLSVHDGYANVGKTIVVEYSSPNTNKPLHLGHLRNICLGYSVCQMLKHVGYKVHAVTLINDRGIHICKSMLAYMKECKNAIPSIKGDHFVGDYYVTFDKMVKEQKATLNITEDKDTPLMHEAQELLVKWEQGDEAVRALWKTMSNWVLKGFEETYDVLGIRFDKTYLESETYLLGKDIISEGLEKNIFYKDPQGAVWIDLTSDGLDRKLLLRADGTSVYITQDLGTADMRQQHFAADRMIYVVGDEQEYHFKVLKKILQRLGRGYAEHIYHLSYGMIDLPSGKMKSREGTVVEADDIINDLIDRSRQQTQQLRGEDYVVPEEVSRVIALAALKFYLLKINAKKRITFDPNKSIDFRGDTGPFILYTYVRINSILTKSGYKNTDNDKLLATSLTNIEKKLIMTISYYRKTIDDAVWRLDPSVLAQYILHLAKTYNKFYDNCSILNEQHTDKRLLRLFISSTTAQIIKDGLSMLGIDTVNKM
ncbi:MAG: arginine--tRNA ligase [Cytophagales bacterium]|nr:arginine--tRNA ligase [Cytophagales bacterium]